MRVIVTESSLPEKRSRTKYVWRCELCGRCLCSKRSYLEHKNTHVAARPFKCEYCDYAAASQMTLRRHTLRQHIPRSHWHYPCPYCDQAFVEPTSYQAHLRHKHTGYSGTFGCDLCDYKTLSNKNFADHHHSKHDDTRTAQQQTDASKSMADNKRYINKYLIDDELGVGWSSQRPGQLTVGKQLASLRRLTVFEQQRRRKAEHLQRPSKVRSDARHQEGPSDQHVVLAPAKHEQLVTEKGQKGGDSGVAGAWNDHEYQYAKQSAAADPAEKSLLAGRPCIVLSANEPYLVPHAEIYVEVGTDAAPVENTVEIGEVADTRESSAAVAVSRCDSSSSIDSTSTKSDDEDDDDLSCSSSSSNEPCDLGIDSRLTALAGGTDEIANSASLDEDEADACNDLGNDVLPDGQVDFDLD